jgi:hypothetical protein
MTGARPTATGTVKPGSCPGGWDNLEIPYLTVPTAESFIDRVSRRELLTPPYVKFSLR